MRLMRWWCLLLLPVMSLADPLLTQEPRDLWDAYLFPWFSAMEKRSLPSMQLDFPGLPNAQDKTMLAAGTRSRPMSNGSFSNLYGVAQRDSKGPEAGVLVENLRWTSQVDSTAATRSSTSSSWSPGMSDESSQFGGTIGMWLKGGDENPLKGVSGTFAPSRQTGDQNQSYYQGDTVYRTTASHGATDDLAGTATGLIRITRKGYLRLHYAWDAIIDWTADTSRYGAWISSLTRTEIVGYSNELQAGFLYPGPATDWCAFVNVSARHFSATHRSEGTVLARDDSTGGFAEGFVSRRVHAGNLDLRSGVALLTMVSFRALGRDPASRDLPKIYSWDNSSRRGSLDFPLLLEWHAAERLSCFVSWRPSLGYQLTKTTSGFSPGVHGTSSLQLTQGSIVVFCKPAKNIELLVVPNFSSTLTLLNFEARWMP